MSEVRPVSVEHLSKSVEGVLDLEQLSIKLKGKDRRFVDFFGNLEKKIFSGSIPDVGPLQINESAKKQDFVKILVDSARLLIEELGSKHKKVSDFAEKKEIAEIEEKEFTRKISSIPGINESATPDDAHEGLEQVASYVYGILFEYILEGGLTIEQIMKLGFGQETIDAITQLTIKQKENEFNNWKSNLEKWFPDLITLKSEISKLVANDKDASAAMILRRTLLENARIALAAHNKGEKAAYLEENYWKPVEENLSDLSKRNEEYQKLQTTENEIKIFDGQVRPFRDLLTKTTDEIIRPIEEMFSDPKAGEAEATALKKKFKIKKFSDLTNHLSKILHSLDDNFNNLRAQPFFKKRQANSEQGTQINNLIEELTLKHKEVATKLEKLSDPERMEQISVRFMTIEEIVDALFKGGWDPFMWAEMKHQPAGLMKDLVQEFKGRAFGKESNPKKELERIVQKVRLQLKAWDDVGMDESGKATVKIDALEGEGVNKRVFERREFLLATTYHPTWGKDVREMLNYMVKTAALEPGQWVVLQNGKETVVHSAKKPPKSLYSYNPDFSYEKLASERGREYLGAKMEQWKKSKKYDPQAIWFAEKLFTSFDMLSVSLMQLQRKTKTRAHNGALKMVDLIMLWDPLAAYVHRSERYGDTQADWVGWWLYYLKDKAFKKGNKEFGRAPGSTESQKKHDAYYLHEKQRLIKDHQGAYFDGNGSEGEIDTLGFCESYFPHFLDLFTLGNNEALEYPDGTIRDSKGNNVVVKKGEKKPEVTEFGLYFLAQNGWKNMLDVTFKALPQDLSYEQLLEEAEHGGKGGILAMMLGSGAGKAKMFPGRHLEMAFKPLLLHLIRRAFAQYQAHDRNAELRLFRGVMTAIEGSKAETAGFGTYKALLTQVQKELKGTVYGEMSESLKKRSAGHRYEQTKKYMDHFLEKELGIKPPAHFMGNGANFSKDPEIENYLRVMKNDAYGNIPLPLTREGDLLQKEE